MPIKYFCDICGEEVASDYVFRVKLEYFDAEEIRKKFLISEEVILCYKDADDFANKIAEFIKKELNIK